MLAPDTVGTALVALGMLFAPFISLQPVTPPPLITYADVFLVAGFLVLAPRLVRQPLRVPMPFLTGAFVLLCVGLLSIAVHPDVGRSISGVLRLAYAAIALPLFLAWWRPSPRRITLLAASYFLGGLVSLGYGLVVGPREDGRHLGLATHPNGFGISLMLGLALVPFLASRMPRHRWLLNIGAALGAYGVWASGSRAAFAVLLVLVMAYVIIERSAGALLLVLAGGAVLASTWSQLVSTDNGNALARLAGTQSAEDSSAQRRALLMDGVEQVMANPLLGGGFDQIRVAHNIYVQLAAALGLVALAAFVVMLGSLLLPLVTAPRPMHRLAYPSLAFVLIGPLTDTLVDTSIWVAVALSILALSERERV